MKLSFSPTTKTSFIFPPLHLAINISANDPHIIDIALGEQISLRNMHMSSGVFELFNNNCECFVVEYWMWWAVGVFAGFIIRTQIEWRQIRQRAFSLTLTSPLLLISSPLKTYWNEGQQGTALTKKWKATHWWWRIKNEAGKPQKVGLRARHRRKQCFPLACQCPFVNCCAVAKNTFLSSSRQLFLLRKVIGHNEKNQSRRSPSLYYSPNTMLNDGSQSSTQCHFLLF